MTLWLARRDHGWVNIALVDLPREMKRSWEVLLTMKTAIQVGVWSGLSGTTFPARINPLDTRVRLVLLENEKKN